MRKTEKTTVTERSDIRRNIPAARRVSGHKRHRYLTVSAAILLCFSLLFLSACGTTATDPDSGTFTPPDGTPPDGGMPGGMDNGTSGGGTVNAPDEVASVTTGGVTLADFSALCADTSADGATVLNGSDEVVTIGTAGNYILTGNFTAGIVISVGKGETVHLFLNNANISLQNDIALSDTNKKSDLILTLLPGTENVVSTAGEDVNAIHVKGNLSINGTGKLTVKSDHKNAVKVTKTLLVADATLVLCAAGHGINAAAVEMLAATVTVSEAGKDGIHAECDDDVTAFPEGYTEGYVILRDTAYACEVSGDGIQADTLVYITGGTLDIRTHGTFVRYSSDNMTTYDLSADDFRYVLSGGVYRKVDGDANSQLSGRYAMIQSAKGIKVGTMDYTDADGHEVSVTDGAYLLVVTGGAVLDVNATDDALHVNGGDLLIESGTLTLATLDDGIHADGAVQICGGDITVTNSYEGVEGAYVTITGGTLRITASDDGINAASDDSTVTPYVVIRGGNVTVDAEGDGIDANGSLLIAGGTVTVYGPTNGGNGGLDADRGTLVTGGTLFVTSALGMVEVPGSNSTQYVVSYAQNVSLTAGTVVTLRSSDGTEILSVVVNKTCQSVILSTPELKNGETYTLYGGETELASFTVSGILTYAGTASSGGGMGGQPGGAFPGGNPPGGMGGNRPGRS